MRVVKECNSWIIYEVSTVWKRLISAVEHG